MKKVLGNIKEAVQKIYNKFYLAIMGLAMLPYQSVFATQGDELVGDIFQGGKGETGAGIGEAFGKIEGVAVDIVQGITGVLAVVMVGCFAWKAFTLSRCGDNPSERARTLQGMIFFFIGAAAFGASFFLVELFLNILR